MTSEPSQSEVRSDHSAGTARTICPAAASRVQPQDGQDSQMERSVPVISHNPFNSQSHRKRQRKRWGRGEGWLYREPLRSGPLETRNVGTHACPQPGATETCGTHQDHRLHSNKEAGSKVRQAKPAETPWTGPPSLLQHQDKTHTHTHTQRERDRERLKLCMNPTVLAHICMESKWHLLKCSWWKHAAATSPPPLAQTMLREIRTDEVGF